MSYQSLLINTCTLVISTPAADDFTDPVLSTIPNVKCRIMVGNRQVRNAQGELVVSYAKLFFLRTQSLNNAMSVRINGIDHPIIKLSEHQDSIKTHHKEVYIE